MRLTGISDWRTYLDPLVEGEAVADDLSALNPPDDVAIDNAPVTPPPAVVVMEVMARSQRRQSLRFGAVIALLLAALVATNWPGAHRAESMPHAIAQIRQLALPPEVAKEYLKARAEHLQAASNHIPAPSKPWVIQVITIPPAERSTPTDDGIDGIPKDPDGVFHHPGTVIPPDTINPNGPSPVSPVNLAARLIPNGLSPKPMPASEDSDPDSDPALSTFPNQTTGASAGDWTSYERPEFGFRLPFPVGWRLNYSATRERLNVTLESPFDGTTVFVEDFRELPSAPSTSANSMMDRFMQNYMDGAQQLLERQVHPRGGTGWLREYLIPRSGRSTLHASVAFLDGTTSHCSVLVMGPAHAWDRESANIDRMLAGMTLN